jgi:hypothetical protein
VASGDTINTLELVMCLERTRFANWRKTKPKLCSLCWREGWLR